MALNGKVLMRRYKTLLGAASTHFAVCDEMAPYVAPSRVGMQGKRSVGQRQNRQVFDSTTMMAAELMANFVASSSMNPAQTWGSMRVRLGEATDPVQEWFEDSRDRMLRDFAGSMFYAESPETLVDWVGFGTGALVTDERPQPINRTIRGWRGSHYEAHQTGRFVIADGQDGLVDTIMYEKDQSAGLLAERFGNENLPEAVRKAIKEGEQDRVFTVVHIIQPRSQSDREFAAGAKKMPWMSVWIEKESEQIMLESGYPEFPAAIPRYSRTPREVMGRGRGHLAFPDTWTANTSKRMSFEDWALKIKPPVLHAHDSVIGSIRLVPGGPTSIQTRGRSIGDVIQAYQTGSHPEVSQIIQEDLRKSIRQIFFIEQILALMEVNKSEMTAFEFAKKLELLFQLLGPVYGRLRKEFLERIWMVKFLQMFEADAFAPPPAEFFNQDEIEFDIVFENPLERAQRAGDVEAIQFFLNDIAPMLAFAPEAKDRLNIDGATAHIAKIRGVPASLTNTDEEMAALRDARSAQVAQEEQVAQVGQVAEAAGKVAPLVTALQGGTAR